MVKVKRLWTKCCFCKADILVLDTDVGSGEAVVCNECGGIVMVDIINVIGTVGVKKNV